MSVGVCSVQSDANNKVQENKYIENVDGYGGNNDVVRGIVDENVADEHGTHNDAIRDDMNVEENLDECLIWSFIAAALLLKLKSG